MGWFYEVVSFLLIEEINYRFYDKNILFVVKRFLILGMFVCRREGWVVAVFVELSDF